MLDFRSLASIDVVYRPEVGRKQLRRDFGCGGRGRHAAAAAAALGKRSDVPI